MKAKEIATELKNLGYYADNFGNTNKFNRDNFINIIENSQCYTTTLEKFKTNYRILIGTEKQVSWAIILRDKRANELVYNFTVLLSMCWMYIDIRQSEASIIDLIIKEYKRVYNLILSQSKAIYFIDNRNETIYDYLSKFKLSNLAEIGVIEDFDAYLNKINK